MTKKRPHARILVVLALMAPYLWMPQGLKAADVKLAEEARLYSLSDLGPVDLNIKSVRVEIYAEPAPELQPFTSMLPLVWPQVQQFYARMGVNVVQIPGGPKPGLLAPAERVRLEALSHQEWLARSFKAFQVAPPFRLSFLSVCQNKYAFAHLPLSVIHFSYKRFQEAIFDPKPGFGRQNRHTLANLIIHELGHLMGLYHAHEFSNDPIEEMLPDGKTPNFMSHYLTFPGDLGFVPFQKQLIHSYLGKGKVFQQYKEVEFDPVRYLELVRKYNGYREAAKDCRKEEF